MNREELEKKYPHLIDQMSNLVKTVKEISESPELSEQELYDKRMEICKGCGHYDKRNVKVRACGCFLKAKARFKKPSCPLDKWPV